MSINIDLNQNFVAIYYYERNLMINIFSDYIDNNIIKLEAIIRYKKIIKLQI